MKLITTHSGAEYIVSKMGIVIREPGDTDIANTQGGYQYTQGWLLTDYSDVVVGQRFEWYGVLNDKIADIMTTTRIIEMEILNG